MPTLTSCPHCRTVAMPRQESCLRCGQALEAPVLACAGCGSPHDERDRFCSHCGRSLTTPVEAEPPPPGEPPFLPEPQRFPRRLVALLAVFAALLVSVTGLKIVDGRYFRPGNAVVAFFEALADRDADAAIARLAVAPDGDSTLLRTAVLRSGGYTPPSDVRVGAYEVTADRATVEAEFRVGGTSHRREFSLVRDAEATAGIFYRWRIDGGVFPLDVAASGVDSVLVAGTPVALAASEYGRNTLPALPGSYRVTLPEQPLLEATESVVHVGVSDTEYASVLVEPVVKNGAREAVDQQIRAYLEDCAEQPVLAPVGCPFSSYSFGEVRNVRWKIDEYPPYDLRVDEGGAILTNVQYGTATVTGKSVSSFGSGTYPYEDTVTFTIAGTITASGGTINFLPAAD
ncbi:zinc ribbon domain-containing protein [Actinoplanes sp. RD1]|uniref:zinc ribbon domain-containing protein n=1 Tax=Actinoplanes sp. RD1 TaxID=3064538 RepID=UPI0027410E7D|nr:zinc ribbon domain-containing protein [Actinoplanes sp. RD1]